MPTLCALCKVNADLKNSHIIPEFFYKPIYDTLHRFHLIPSDSSKPEKFAQKGMRGRLLCGECELKFSRWENYANQAFVETHGVHVVCVKNRIVLQGIEYKTFKLFLLSLLWRMSVCTLPFFDKVELGPHEEKIRLALFNDDPLQPGNYPCALTAVKIDGVFYPDWHLSPTLIKHDGHHVYRLVVRGVLIMFFVGSHPPPSALGWIILSKKNELSVTVEEIRNISFLKSAALNLGRAINARKSPR